MPDSGYEPATMASVRASFATAPVISLQELTLLKPVLIMAPHADDETLGCGGLIALLAKAGVHVTVTLLTDGTRSHIGSAAYPPDTLRDTRELELQAALECLGADADDILYFREPDGFLHQGPQQAILDGLSAEIRSRNIRTVFVTWAADPHPDHQAAAVIASRLAMAMPELRLYSYPIWGLTLDDEVEIRVDHMDPVKLDVREAHPAKMRAIAAHASQSTALIDDCPNPFRLSQEDVALFSGEHEIFIPMTRVADAASTSAPSVPREHFEALYARAPDPWEYETNDYEKDKYAKTLSMLPLQRYGRALELGCSIGVLTALLAKRCNELIGVDCAAAAVDAARLRLSGEPHVVIRQMQAPAEMPEGLFDLIVLSEVLYFFADPDLVLIAGFVRERLRPGGTCILVNFLGDTESPQTGDGAASTLIGQCIPPLEMITRHRHENYRIDVMAAPRARGA